MTLRLGIDTGGTFTDFVLVDEAAGRISHAKVPSTPGDPARRDPRRARAARRRRRRVAGHRRHDGRDQRGDPAPRAARSSSSPTPASRTSRSSGAWTRSASTTCTGRSRQPLVRRRDCFGIAGRVDHHGDEIEPLDRRRPERAAPSSWRSSATTRRSWSPSACLFSYLRPRPRATRPRGGPSERCPSAAISRLSRGLADLARVRAREHDDRRRLRQAGRRRATSTGSAASSSAGSAPSTGTCSRRTAATSAPTQAHATAGPAAALGPRRRRDRRPPLRRRGRGTRPRSRSTWAGPAATSAWSLDGGEQYATEFDVALGIPATIPCVAVKTIGAGGGSIAWIDKRRPAAGRAAERRRRAGSGCLRAGRRRADAHRRQPRARPARSATTSSAARMDARRPRPRVRAYAGLGERLGLNARAGRALGADATADENMANAIRLIAVERGLDPRDFALDRLRRRRAAARPRGRRAARNRDRARSHPHPGPLLGLRRRDRRRRASTVSRPTTRAPTSLDVAGARRRRRAAAARRRRRGAARAASRSSDRRSTASHRLRYAGQNYELEVEMPPATLDDRLAETAASASARARAPVRLRPARRAGRAHQPAGDRAPGPSSRCRLARPPRAPPRPAGGRPVWFDDRLAARMHGASARSSLDPRSDAGRAGGDRGGGLDHARPPGRPGSSSMPSGGAADRHWEAGHERAARARHRRPPRPPQRADQHRLRDGAGDDEDVLLDDLQRGARLHDRAARPPRRPDRREELHAVDDGRDPAHGEAGRSRRRRSSTSSPATSSSTTTATAAAATCPST